MRKGKQLTERIELLTQDKIRTDVEKETYKYLEILEADTITQEEMKENFFKKYLKRTGMLLETKLCSRNFMTGINTWVVPTAIHSEPFSNWIWEEHQKTSNVVTHLNGEQTYCSLTLVMRQYPALSV